MKAHSKPNVPGEFIQINIGFVLSVLREPAPILEFAGENVPEAIGALRADDDDRLDAGNGGKVREETILQVVAHVGAGAMQLEKDRADRTLKHADPTRVARELGDRQASLEGDERILVDELLSEAHSAREPWRTSPSTS